MSAYKLFESVQFPNANLLISALEAMGYTPQKGEALPLRGFGSQRTAQIVVPHEQIKGCWYDLGFVWNGAAYVPVIEDYAARTILNLEWRQKLQATYAKVAILTFLARQGATMNQTQTLADGSLVFSATMEV